MGVSTSGDFSKTVGEAKLPLKCQQLNGQIYTVVLTVNLLKMRKNTSISKTSWLAWTLGLCEMIGGSAKDQERPKDKSFVTDFEL